MGDMKKGIEKLSNQKYSMMKVMNTIAKKKQQFIEYNYYKARKKIDDKLVYLLNKIAAIDGGPTAEAYLEKNNYVLSDINV